MTSTTTVSTFLFRFVLQLGLKDTSYLRFCPFLTVIPIICWFKHVAKGALDITKSSEKSVIIIEKAQYA